MKSPGLDGYGARIFKFTWSILKHDVIAAVREFSKEGRIYKAINYVVITLNPKSSATKTITDYRPISCCYIIYKIISKVINKRLSKVLGNIIQKIQAAFVPR